MFLYDVKLIHIDEGCEKMDPEILTDFDIPKFQNDLIDWYTEIKRDLPWRKDQDPYKIWVSEIMLQQTKVDTVIPYFERFITKFPTVYDLAEAEAEDVLKAWEGLGYYSRARNLQSAVKEVVASYNGEVPNDVDKLGSLKGIGPYTKGAIMSIAFDQPEPAVDGNVMRVLSRVLLIKDDIAIARVKKDFEVYTKALISHTDPSSFNQGIMELGALVCTPRSPMCLLCPVQTYCRAYAVGVESELPVKSKAKKKKKLHYAAFLIRNERGEIMIEKRPSIGLLADLWQFPMIEKTEDTSQSLEKAFENQYGFKVEKVEEAGKLKHVFTHLIWEIDVYKASTDIEATVIDPALFVKINDLEIYPTPVPHQKMRHYLR